MSKSEKTPQEKFQSDIIGALQTKLGKSLNQDQLEQVQYLAHDIEHINDGKAMASLDKGVESILTVTGLKASEIGPITEIVANYHKSDQVKQTLVESAMKTFGDKNGLEPVVEKTPQEKFQSDIIGALQTKLGKPLNQDQLEQVQYLAHDIEHINDGKAMASLDKGVESILTVTGLKASEIGPITEIVANYHKSDSVKQKLVQSALEPFKVNELNQQITTELEKLTDRKLTEPELLMVSELSQSVGYIRDKDDVGTLTRPLDEVVKNLTLEQAKPILDLVANYHKGDKEKQALVSPVLDNVTLKKEPEIEVALDSFRSPSPSTGSSVGTPSVDEITQAIRDEIITKQQVYLQGEIAKTMGVDESTAFKNKTPEEMRAYLGTEEGKEAVKEVMKTKEAQLAMNKIEVEGYKKVHSQFQDSFKNVGWDQETGTKVRIAEIKNEAGEKVASLKETTVDATPTQVTLEDGTTRTVKSYRQIDFPTQLDNGKGPAHFSMAVKDENGRNISSKDAVYFTAHYDDDGKLTEVSSPVPVKFMGKGDDAIGYIERDGKVYTLPVTQGKYKEMMKEVAINNGLGVDLGQDVAVDTVSVGPRTVEVELQAPEILKKSGPVTIDPVNLEKVGPTTIDPEVLKKSGTESKVTNHPTFAEELQAKKESLTKTDRGAEVYGYEKPEPKTNPDPTKKPSPPTFAEELQAKKESLTKTDRGAEVYGYEKPGPKTSPETKLTSMPPPEIGIIPKDIVTVVSPKVETATVVTNPITGTPISPQVMNKVQEIRQGLDPSSRSQPEVNNGEKALEMLKGKSSKEVLETISSTIGKGDDKLVGAMMDLIKNPPKDSQIPSVGKVALNKIYIEQMESTKNMPLEQKVKVQRTSGAIASASGITDHSQRITSPKQSTGRGL